MSRAHPSSPSGTCRKSPRAVEREPGQPASGARALLNGLLRLVRPPFVYHMDSPTERKALIDKLWSGQYEDSIGRFTASNGDLINLFGQQVEVEAGAADELPIGRPRRPDRLQSSWPRFEGVLLALFRARSQKMVALETAALSVRFLHYRVSRNVWDTVAFFSRLVMHRQWTEQLCDDALKRDPGAPYEVTKALTAACFDNYTIKVGYGSFATVDRKGERFDMTNWGSVSVPASAVPANLSLQAMLHGGIFRDDISLTAFARSFSVIAPDIVANQQKRWRHYMQRAKDGKLDEKPNFASPYPPTHFVWHDPIKDRLQSSYEDVNFEVDWIRAHAMHKDSAAVMLGGDGLTYMRIISRLAQSPRLYLWTSPIIIPRLGEHPHGTYHVLHGDWRLWWPLIERAAVIVGNKQVVADPNVSQFNESEHFLRILTAACAEYVLEIAQTGTDVRATSTFLNDADANLSFAYVCQFLYLFGFKFKQMRDSVRTNDSATLDLLWRENLASARAATKSGNVGESGKTNYATMSVVLIYWGCALREPLATAYHNTRTLRWIFSHVGWDMPVEMLNMLIHESVVANITHELIQKFVRRLNFTWVVHRGLERILKANRARDEATLKDIDKDKKLLMEWLRTSIGTTYAQATQASNDNLLGVDMSRWGGDRDAAAKRRGAPWAKRVAVMQDCDEYVRRKMRDYCHWHSWQV